MELNSKLRSAQEALHALGPKRQTHMELSVYMIGLATQFQNISRQATCSGLSDIVDQDDTLRLATMAVNRSEMFATAIADNGHMFLFDSEQGTKSSKRVIEDAFHFPDEDTKSPDKIKTIETRHHHDHPDIEDMTGEHRTAVTPAKKDGIAKWLEGVYLNSRGFELGSFDTSLLAVTLKHQAQKWKDFAFGYVSDVITLVHSFIMRVLKKVAPDDRVRDRVKEILLDKLRVKYGSALAHTEFLLRVELEGTPATLNGFFNDTLEKWYVPDLSFLKPNLRLLAGSSACVTSTKTRFSSTRTKGQWFDLMIWCVAIHSAIPTIW